MSLGGIFAICLELPPPKLHRPLLNDDFDDGDHPMAPKKVGENESRWMIGNLSIIRMWVPMKKRDGSILFGLVDRWMDSVLGCEWCARPSQCITFSWMSLRGIKQSPPAWGQHIERFPLRGSLLAAPFRPMESPTPVCAHSILKVPFTDSHRLFPFLLCTKFDILMPTRI
jgi:hypothetical protein